MIKYTMLILRNKNRWPVWSTYDMIEREEWMMGWWPWTWMPISRRNWGRNNATPELNNYIQDFSLPVWALRHPQHNSIKKKLHFCPTSRWVFDFIDLPCPFKQNQDNELNFYLNRLFDYNLRCHLIKTYILVRLNNFSSNEFILLEPPYFVNQKYLFAIVPYYAG